MFTACEEEETPISQSRRTRTPLLCRAYWLTHNTATDLAFVISLIYWTLVYDPSTYNKSLIMHTLSRKKSWAVCVINRVLNTVVNQPLPDVQNHLIYYLKNVHAYFFYWQVIDNQAYNKNSHNNAIPAQCFASLNIPRVSDDSGI